MIAKRIAVFWLAAALAACDGKSNRDASQDDGAGDEASDGPLDDPVSEPDIDATDPPIDDRHDEPAFDWPEEPTGAVYYVAKDGNDDNPGTEELPWLTLQHAADTLVAGETVYVKEGTYNEQVMPQNSGSSGMPISYMAYPGDAVTLDGAGIDFNWAGLFHIQDRSFIRVSGFSIVDSAFFGVYVSGNGVTDIMIDGLTVIESQSSGIQIFGRSSDPRPGNIVIRGNRVERPCANGDQEGISLSAVDGFEVSGNAVIDSFKEGIDAKDGCANGIITGNEVQNADYGGPGIYIDAYDLDSSNIEVFGNVVHGQGEGLSLGTEQGGSLVNIKLVNNVVYTDGNGVGIHRFTTDGSHLKRDIVIINNTFHVGGICIQVTAERTTFENFVIRNNILSGPDYGEINFVTLLETDLALDHNLFTSTSSIYGQDYLEGDPLFVDPAGADFHLQAGSPAVDSGSAELAPSTDLDGAARPAGAGFDMGAYEM
jgi:hypothetical protein